MVNDNIKLYNIDCIELLNSIEDNTVDCIVTSPPYNKSFFNHCSYSNQNWKNFEIKYNTYSDDMPIEDYERWMIEFLQLCVRKLKPTGSLFFNHKPIRTNNSVYFPLKFILESGVKIYQEIIWDRRGSANIRNDILMPSTERIYWIVKDKPKVYRNNIDSIYRGEVWNIYPTPNEQHPAPFPVELPLTCIKLTTEKGALVVDPFMGVGDTMEACLQTDRKFIGTDIDRMYYDICINKVDRFLENSKYKGRDLFE